MRLNPQQALEQHPFVATHGLPVLRRGRWGLGTGSKMQGNSVAQGIPRGLLFVLDVEWWPGCCSPGITVIWAIMCGILATAGGSLLEACSPLGLRNDSSFLLKLTGACSTGTPQF